MQHDDPLAEHEQQPPDVQARLAYLANAEDASWQAFGRGLTLYELWRVIACYPGDAAEATEREQAR